jgi:hypothetical protein
MKICGITQIYQCQRNTNVNNFWFWLTNLAQVKVTLNLQNSLDLNLRATGAVTEQGRMLGLED